MGSGQTRWEIEEVTTVIQKREDGDSDHHRNIDGIEKYSDNKHILKVVPQDLLLNGMWGLREKQKLSMTSLRCRRSQLQGNQEFSFEKVKFENLLDVYVSILQRQLDFSGEIRLQIYLKIVCILMAFEARCFVKYQGGKCR